MDILKQLSTQSGDKTSQSNKNVAEICIQNPKLLPDIATGLTCKDTGMIKDCVEVMTLVAEKKPDFVAPFAKQITPLLSHKNTQARWEAAHSLSYVAHLVPGVISSVLGCFEELIEKDESIIIRDYSVDAVSNFAKAGKSEAEKAYPILLKALLLWNGKHAHHTFSGLESVVKFMPNLKKEVVALIGPFTTEKRAVVSKVAKSLLKKLG